MNTKSDLRIIRTHKSLTEAFLQLMSEKQFENITVNELCDRAMIRRTTFYKHFADKYEFFRFFVEQLQADFDTKSAASAKYQNPQVFFTSIMCHLLDFLREHKNLVHMILSSNLLPTLLNILSESIIFDITKKIKAGAQQGVAIPASPEVMASFYTGALIHTAKWWLMQKKQLSEEKLIQEVEKILLACH